MDKMVFYCEPAGFGLLEKHRSMKRNQKFLLANLSSVKDDQEHNKRADKGQTW